MSFDTHFYLPVIIVCFKTTKTIMTLQILIKLNIEIITTVHF